MQVQHGEARAPAGGPPHAVPTEAAGSPRAFPNTNAARPNSRPAESWRRISTSALRLEEGNGRATTGDAPTERHAGTAVPQGLVVEGDDARGADILVTT